MNTSSEKVFWVVVDRQKPARLDRLLSEKLRPEGVSREKIKTAIRNGFCTVDKKICCEVDRKLFSGEHISLTLQTSSSPILPEEGDVEILYQDEHLLVINKAAGLIVHPAPSCPEGTLVHRLLSRFPQLEAQGGLRPGIVHRLDKDTSGILCIALTEEARLNLTEAFAKRIVHKQYLALVAGVPESGSTPPLRGSINLPIGRHPSKKTHMAVVTGGKPASTEWEIKYIGAGARYSLVAVRIHTGRTHQIRVHMTHMGHPLLGDAVYGTHTWAKNCAPRQMLHAWKLELTHPVTGKALCFLCPPPNDFLQTMLSLEKGMRKIIVTSVAGCGKSACMHVISEQGIPVWSADAAVIQLYEPGQAGWKKIRERFGERFVPSSDQPVDRKALALALLPKQFAQDFHMEISDETDPIDKEEVESLIHPLVFQDLDRFWERCEQQGHALAVAEVPLWFETMKQRDLSKEDFFLLGLSCTETERQRRLLDIRGWSPDFMAYMDAQQWPQAKKMALCDYVIHNDGSLEDLKKQCLLFLDTLKKEEQKKKYFFQTLLCE